MTARLVSNGVSVQVLVPLQRAYPRFIVYKDDLFENPNPASTTGIYDFVSRVHVAHPTAVVGEDGKGS